MIVLCFVFPVAVAEAGNGKGNGNGKWQFKKHGGKGSTNSNFLNGKPFAALSEAISINSGAIVQIKSEIAEIQTQLSEMASDFSDLELRVFANEDAISALESRTDELVAAISEARANLAILESILAALQADVAANQDDIEALEAAIVKVKSEIEANWAEMEKILAELRQELDVQRAALDVFKEEFAEYRLANNETIASLQNEMTGAIAEIAAADTVDGGTLATILLLQDAINNITSDLIALNSSFITLSERFNGHTHMYYDSWQLFYGAFRVTGKPSNPLSSQ